MVLPGTPLGVHGSIEELLILDSLPEVYPGDHLDYHHHTVTTDQVHHNLIDFWNPRWNCDALQQGETWARRTSFVKAYVPKTPLVLPPLTVETWRKALQRFKPHAARGADGWARLDLIKMSTTHATKLLKILTAIEQRQMTWPTWPKQLLEGLVIAIAKCDVAHKPNELRPIVLLSIIYRCWASLCARQMLQQIEPFIHADAHGFLPSREPAQTWLQIQAAVETSLQSTMPSAGIGTDFVKAFNCIQRKPLWFLADALGIPHGLLGKSSQRSSHAGSWCVTNQWPCAVFPRFCRRMPVERPGNGFGALGAPDIPIPICTHSSMLARQAELVAWAFFTLKAFLTMWGLSLDLDKTCAWGTTTATRQQLGQLGVRVVQDTSVSLGAPFHSQRHIECGRSSRKGRHCMTSGHNCDDQGHHWCRSSGPYQWSSGQKHYMALWVAWLLTGTATSSEQWLSNTLESNWRDQTRNCASNLQYLTRGSGLLPAPACSVGFQTPLPEKPRFAQLLAHLHEKIWRDVQRRTFFQNPGTAKLCRMANFGASFFSRPFFFKTMMDSTLTCST